MRSRRLTNFQLGYIAGIIDGEGYIKAKYLPKNKHDPNQAFIGITNTNLEMLMHLQKLLKAGFITNKRNKHRGHYKPVHSLVIRRREDVEWLANLLKEKLIIKKNELENLLEHLSKFPLKRTIHFWRKDEIKFLLDNYKKMSYKEIAEKLNRSQDSVYKKAKSLKLKKGRMTDERRKLREKAILLFEQHLSTSKIAEIIGIPKQTVKYWLWIYKKGSFSY